MATDRKVNINIRIAGVKTFALSVPESERAMCEESETLVNRLWNRWMELYKDTDTSEEVMAKVAFQFARLYHQAYTSNLKTGQFLKDFEKDLDDILLTV